MNLRENYPSNSVPCSWASFQKKRKLRKLRKSFLAVLIVESLTKSMRWLCVDPPAAGVEPEPEEISTHQRKEQENFHPSQYEPRVLKLRFSNSISGQIFTGRPLGGDQGNTLSLDLVDPRTQNIVKSGPEASAEVEILVLDKEFRSYNQGYWTSEEFENTVVPDKKLMIRDPHVTLKDGSVSVSHILIKHTRVHWRKREIRLGARAVHPYNGTRIMEAVTEPFFVKDRRNMSKSQRPLTLGDEVCKLLAIGKGGFFHKGLMKENIKTVRDFLTQYFLNPEKLVSIPGTRKHTVDEAVNHAKSKVELQRCLYPSAKCPGNVRVVFTDVGEVIGVIGQESHFVSVEKLSGTQKAHAHKLVKTAFANWENVLTFDSELSIMDHVASSSKDPPLSCLNVGSPSGCQSGNLAMFNELRHSELQNTSKSYLIQETTENNQCMVSAGCSSYAIADQLRLSNGMSLAITFPGHSRTGLRTLGNSELQNDIATDIVHHGSSNQFTSLIQDSGDTWEKINQEIISDKIQFDNSTYGVSAANYSAAETRATQFRGLQHGERMDLPKNQFTNFTVSENVQSVIHEDGTNIDQLCVANNASVVPVASGCKDKSKKRWAKLSSTLICFSWARLVKLRVRITKKRKFCLHCAGQTRTNHLLYPI